MFDFYKYSLSEKTYRITGELHYRIKYCAFRILSIMGKLIKIPKPKLLKDKREALLKTILQRYSKAPKPIIQVDGSTCKIISNFAAIRNLFIIPWLIGLCLTAYWNIDEFIGEWKGAERATLNFIEVRKNKYGEDYFSNTDNLVAKRWYDDIGPDEKMSFHEYLHHRYNNYAYSERMLKADIGVVVFHGLGLPGLLFWAIRFRRRAPLIFDRKRGLVMTWRSGKAAVQRYDELGIIESASSLAFLIPMTKLKTGKIKRLWFAVQPSGNPIINDIESYQPILAFITQFMEFGLEKVLPEGPMEEKEPNFYFFEDKKPDDFEEQLENILKMIDEEKVDEVTTVQA